MRSPAGIFLYQLTDWGRAEVEAWANPMKALGYGRAALGAGELNPPPHLLRLPMAS